MRAAGALLLVLAGCSSTPRSGPDVPPATDWMAIGQEPGWRVDIRAGQGIEVIADYGDRRASLPYVRPEVRAGVLEFHSFGGGNEFRLRITETACADGMSGRPYPATAEMELNGRSYRGCAQSITP